ISEERHSVMRICQALAWKVRTSLKRYSMAPILPGLISMELNFSIVRSCWLRGTGNRPSAMRRLPAVRLFPIGCLRNNKYLRSPGPTVPKSHGQCLGREGYGFTLHNDGGLQNINRSFAEMHLDDRLCRQQQLCRPVANRVNRPIKS